MNKEKLSETEHQIISIYLVQMLGCPTVKQIQQVMTTKMGVKANRIKILNAVNSAKKRGILSVNNMQNSETEEVEEGFSMKDVRFSNPPEIAHIKNVLPKLLEDEGSKEIFDIMEGQHTEGQKKGRLPDIRDYTTFDVVFKNVLPVLGGQPYAKGNGEANGEKGVSATNKHRRIGNKIWIPGNLWVRSGIRNELREYNINESKALYIKVNDYFFEPNPKMLTQEICSSPPQRRGGPGTGLTSYEAINPGQTFQFKIKFPTTNGIPKDVMKQILSNLRIGARHKDYGLLSVEEIKES